MNDQSLSVDIILYYTVFPMPHVEEANKIIVIVIVIVLTFERGRFPKQTLTDLKSTNLSSVSLNQTQIMTQ